MIGVILAFAFIALSPEISVGTKVLREIGDDFGPAKEMVRLQTTFGMGNEVAVSRIAVVREKDAPWLVQFAANELADYLERMSEASVSLGTRITKPCIVLGTYEESANVRTLLPKQPEIFRKSQEAFVIKSVEDALVIAGASPRAVLYGAYHYLDYLCGIGFFEDGERIPKRETIPIYGVNVEEAPMFQIRLFGGMWDAWGDFIRNRSTYWSFDEYRKHYLWAIKNKVNRLGPMSSRCFPIERAFRYFSRFVPLSYGPSDGLPLAFSREGMEAVKREFPDARFTPEEDPNYGGYYLLDLSTYKALLKRRLAVARRRFAGANARCGISLPLGVEGEIHFLRKYLENPREHYVKATIEAAREFDPDAEITVDGWGIALTFKNWREFEEHFVSQLSEDVRREMTIIFNYPFFERFRRDFEYFHGLKWVYADIDFFGGQDYYFAPTPYSKLLEYARDVLTHEGSNCIGWGIKPEITKVEPLYRQWHWKLAWNPFEFDSVDEFLRYYVARRYGERSQELMLESTRAMVQAFEHYEFRTDPYISSFCPVYRHIALLCFPCVQAHWDRYTQWRDCRSLERAVQLALKAAQYERDNPLYRNYLVGVFHAYASELFKFPLIRMHSAYFAATREFAKGRYDSERARGTVQRFEQAAMECDFILAQIERVWATRPDYRLRDMLTTVGERIGMTPQLEREIRGRCGAFLNGVYELMALLYRPWFRIIADDLRQRLRRHEPKLVRCEWTSFEANAINWRDLKRRWNEPPITAWNDELLPRFEKLVAGYFTADLNGIVREYNDSDEVSAIAEAMNALRAHGITADAYSDMQTSGMIENNYPLK